MDKTVSRALWEVRIILCLVSMQHLRTEVQDHLLRSSVCPVSLCFMQGTQPGVLSTLLSNGLPAACQLCCSLCIAENNIKSAC